MFVVRMNKRAVIVVMLMVEIFHRGRMMFVVVTVMMVMI
jgi:hypothetical protein